MLCPPQCPSPAVVSPGRCPKQQRVMRASQAGRNVLCPRPFRLVPPTGHAPVSPARSLGWHPPVRESNHINSASPREGRKASNAGVPGRAKCAVSPTRSVSPPPLMSLPVTAVSPGWHPKLKPGGFLRHPPAR
jgi:hypothetical protein